ncbi:hypothetical protein H6G54_02600 [Anabaena cylindrica FACHB-243]|uniref:Uncharacterized protein n=1 Tax=Anabaena cylindrica (strain ATCC 27899 / PCC 7122) TaxID=272123 RepID=K9ZPY5_ANACC|nr:MULTISPECIES: hypothetical protein [Anabaena]AFZ61278.1 hypothetical protein Anacy_5999 [Anabaena cylindrica PCC 7122]MBD2416616.1 hypothetical protein [Anabaena cylindrica FACHB-243]MBY5284483.1 hypothetical protein [Anabaena sp. CCAP 1446/1C]MBY5306770.1 hypothetical protein [Anabaena sp. CCAP 1446/1C]MCM2410069.1 hypothetical protein [Anabaena sp. CCAP 1446/1C]
MMTQVQSLISGAESNQISYVKEPTAGREPLKHLLIGTRTAVISTIHNLQVLGYADVGDWSQPMPTGNTGEVMSILSRQILIK